MGQRGLAEGIKTIASGLEDRRRRQEEFNQRLELISAQAEARARGRVPRASEIRDFQTQALAPVASGVQPPSLDVIEGLADVGAIPPGSRIQPEQFPAQARDLIQTLRGRVPRQSSAPKPIRTEKFATDLQGSIRRIAEGADAGFERERLNALYPEKGKQIGARLKRYGGFGGRRRARQIGPSFGVGGDLRARAISELETAGYPITDANLQAAMDQLRGG